MKIHTQSAVDAGIWRFFPAINVDRVKDIPIDYPGPIGVPITFIDKYAPEDFEILDVLRPKLNGKNIYCRIIIRHRHPALPEYIEIEELWKKYDGYPAEVLLSESGKDRAE